MEPAVCIFCRKSITDCRCEGEDSPAGWRLFEASVAEALRVVEQMPETDHDASKEG